MISIIFKKSGIFLLLIYSFFFQQFIARGFNSVILLFIAISFILISVLFKAGRNGVLIIPRFYPEQAAWVLLLIWSVLGNYDVFNTDSLNGVFSFTVITMLLLWKSTDWIDFFINSMLAFSFVHAFFTILFFFAPNLDRLVIGWLHIVRLQDSYVSGISNHYSTNGMYISLGMIATAVKVVSGRVKWIVPAAMFLFANLLTSKRGPLFFSIIALFLLYLVTFKVDIKVIIKLTIVIVIVVLIVGRFAISNPEVLNGVNRITESIQDIDTNTNYILNGRDLPYGIAFNMFKEQPILGYGWGAFLAITGLPQVHNIYLQMLAECGIIGFLVLLFCLIRSYIRCAIPLLYSDRTQMDKNKKYHLMFSFTIQSFFIMYGMTGNPLYDGVIIIPILMSYGICYAEGLSKERSTPIVTEIIKKVGLKGDLLR